MVMVYEKDFFLHHNGVIMSFYHCVCLSHDILNRQKPSSKIFQDFDVQGQELKIRGQGQGIVN